MEELPGFIIARQVGKHTRPILLTGMNMGRKSPGIFTCMDISGFRHPMEACGTMSSMGGPIKRNV